MLDLTPSVASLGPQAFAASIRADFEKYARVIKEAGIRLD
jgi:hypothetical protein